MDSGGAVAVPGASPQIVGVVLVHNDDLFLENAVRNVAEFCDRIHAFDHMSSDGTWEILRSLQRELPHLDARRTHHAAESHSAVEEYAGTATWVFGIDGDELYDRGRLAGFRDDLLGGTFDGVFKIASNVVNCVSIDREQMTATGYPSPPSRSITKLYNFAAIEAWHSDGSERLHGGTIEFRRGYDEAAVDNIGERSSWADTPLRCLHACFVRRSTADADAQLRPILMESGLHDRSWRGEVKRRLLRRRPPEESTWKREKYMRGELVTVDASPFL